MIIGIILLVVLLAIVVVLFIGPYNKLVGLRNKLQEAWRQVDVELNRRYDLIPNLIETVRGYAAHESGVLEKVTNLRQSAMALAAQVQGAPSEQRAAAESALTDAVRGLMVSVESYPSLGSNTNYLELQRELADTEDRIAASRRFYNANVRDYNTRIESVPSNVIAGMGKFERATYFETNDPMLRQAPTVNFGQPPLPPAGA